MATLPVVAGTLQTDPRSGGLKRSSGVNVLPSVAEGESTLIIASAFLRRGAETGSMAALTLSFRLSTAIT
jgi:hypothetical protein